MTKVIVDKDEFYKYLLMFLEDYLISSTNDDPEDMTSKIMGVFNFCCEDIKEKAD